MFIILLVPLLAEQGRAQGSFIVGNCVVDETAGTTRCAYIIGSIDPALTSITLPVGDLCADHFDVQVSNPDITFDVPQTYSIPGIGDVFGIRTTQAPAGGTTEEVIIVYQGIFATGMTYAHAIGLPTGEWLSYPVPAVIECPEPPNCDWSIDATRFDFLVRGPGNFMAKLADMRLQANTPVSVQFEAFSDLVPTDGSPAGPVSIEYQLVPMGTEPALEQFVPASSFFGPLITVADDNVEVVWSLWSKISADRQVSAGEYENSASITLVLENMETYTPSK